MGIPYRGLGLITLVGTTHDTSLLYAATRGRRVKHPSPTLMHGGSMAHHQASTTSQIAFVVIRRLPVPHNQAMRTLLLRRYPLRCVQRRDGSRCSHNSSDTRFVACPGKAEGRNEAERHPPYRPPPGRTNRGHGARPAPPPRPAPRHTNATNLPRGAQPPRGVQTKGTEKGPHTRTPAPTARG